MFEPLSPLTDELGVLGQAARLLRRDADAGPKISTVGQISTRLPSSPVATVGRLNWKSKYFSESTAAIELQVEEVLEGVHGAAGRVARVVPALERDNEKPSAQESPVAVWHVSPSLCRHPCGASFHLTKDKTSSPRAQGVTVRPQQTRWRPQLDCWS